MTDQLGELSAKLVATISEISLLFIWGVNHMLVKMQMIKTPFCTLPVA